MYEVSGGPRIKSPRYFGIVSIYVASLGRKITLKTPNTLNPVTMVTHLFDEKLNLPFQSQYPQFENKSFFKRDGKSLQV